MAPKKRVLKKKPVNQKQSQYQRVTVNVNPIKKAPRQPRQTAPRQQPQQQPTHTFYSMQPQAQPQAQPIPQEFMDNIRKISTGFSTNSKPSPIQAATIETQTGTRLTHEDEMLNDMLNDRIARDHEEEILRRSPNKTDSLTSSSNFNGMSRKALMGVDLPSLRSHVRGSDLFESDSANKQTIVSYLLRQRKEK